MAGAVEIVFGLCLLSFTLGAALMYVVTRRREDAEETRPGPAVDALPVPRRTASADDAWVPQPMPDADYDTPPIHRNAVVGLRRAEPEPEPEPVVEAVPEPGPEPVDEEPAEAVLPPPPGPRPAEHTTWAERDEFRERYLRTFDEVRRKAGSN
ncbi:hypothetical protein AB0A63_16700 [Lentzea sp. NPDC042327]|uniref:hypothetical protein n=1 Tax=Lentzea sp. NPDC042327 TaxID=3154801 RepID=UPI0033E1550F